MVVVAFLCLFLCGIHSAVLIQVVPFFKLYYDYVNNYSLAQDRLTYFAKKSRKLDSFLREQEILSKSGALTLEERAELLKSASSSATGHQGQGFPALQALLITPVQRIPRYMLLLKSLIKHTESGHPDCQLLAEALCSVQKATARINEGGNLGEEEESKSNAHHLLRIHKELRGSYANLVRARRLRREGKQHNLERGAKSVSFGGRGDKTIFF